MDILCAHARVDRTSAGASPILGGGVYQEELLESSSNDGADPSLRWSLLIIGNVPSEISFRVAESILASAPLLTSSAVLGSAGIESVGFLIAGVLRLLGDEDSGGASVEVVLLRAEEREENP
jgi:hypothetical protein